MTIRSGFPTRAELSHPPGVPGRLPVIQKTKKPKNQWFQSPGDPGKPNHSSASTATTRAVNTGGVASIRPGQTAYAGRSMPMQLSRLMCSGERGSSALFSLGSTNAHDRAQRMTKNGMVAMTLGSLGRPDWFCPDSASDPCERGQYLLCQAKSVVESRSTCRSVVNRDAGARTVCASNRIGCLRPST